ncbi:FadR/GntR family transcriptional regulator [Herbaspirillum sp. alder98]|uniref:FadR/GntR family transcriptional regulator n=1 Tax=Herbaspirillum sp. alder98 TaxID=2913096 RepID=UPI001CD8CFA4|nr:FadR/GntR family transcriptional regulator [Herbaspirillum sp. alder98]MCA1323170.1 FadR family transcriptional regulator [Herbaspirillum sp. alder98]
MPIEAIEPQRLYRQISDQLRKLIVDGEFQVGSRLPSERDLAVQLGVSRPSLREALIALEVEGYIEVHMGSGIYVRRPSTLVEGEIDLSTEEGPLELIRAREMIEGEVAHAAAQHASDAQITAIDDAFQAMIADTAAGINPLQADRLFHIRVAEATGNSVLVGLVTQLFDARLGPLFKRLHSHFDSKVVWLEAIDEHAQVMQALRARDPAAAREAMRRHMDISFKRYSANLTLRESVRESVREAEEPAPAGRARKAPRARKPSVASAKAGAAKLLAKNKATLAAKPAIKVGARKRSSGI